MRTASFVVAAIVAIIVPVDAKFADTTNFSGKHGVDCGACHAPTPENVWAPATISLDGVPPAWQPEMSYVFEIAVSGGPPPSPLPGRPQGGFELEADAGTFSAPAGMERLLRFPDADGVTYTPEGTLHRSWAVTWTAPALDDEPRAVRFWLAVVSADGGHPMQGPSAVGERGDRVAATAFEVPAARDALDAWQRLAPPAPILDPPGLLRRQDFPLTVRGHVDAAAETVEWRLDRGPWRAAAGARHFLILLDWPGEGDHVLHARAMRNGVASDESAMAMAIAADPSAPAATGSLSWPLLLLLVPVAGILLPPLLLRRRSRPQP